MNNKINNVTTNTGIHTYTLLSYAPEKIFLPHHTCMFNCTANVVFTDTTLLYMYVKNKL